MHVAAMRPLAVDKEEIDPALVAKEREILREAALWPKGSRRTSSIRWSKAG